MIVITTPNQCLQYSGPLQWGSWVIWDFCPHTQWPWAILFLYSSGIYWNLVLLSMSLPSPAWLSASDTQHRKPEDGLVSGAGPFYRAGHTSFHTALTVLSVRCVPAWPLHVALWCLALILVDGLGHTGVSRLISNNREELIPSEALSHSSKRFHILPFLIRGIRNRVGFWWEEQERASRCLKNAGKPRDRGILSNS